MSLPTPSPPSIIAVAGKITTVATGLVAPEKAARVEDLVSTSTLRSDGRLGLTGRRITGVRCVLEECLRAIVTKRRTMRWAPGQGEDIRELENGDFTPTQLERRRASFDAQIRSVNFVVGVASSLRMSAPPIYFAQYIANIVIEGIGVYPLAVTAGPAGKVLADLGGVAS